MLIYFFVFCKVQVVCFIIWECISVGGGSDDFKQLSCLFMIAVVISCSGLDPCTYVGPDSGSGAEIAGLFCTRGRIALALR